ncbi:hypothetical protein ACVBGC_18400 [Burkholderia stagnalis]
MLARVGQRCLTGPGHRKPCYLSMPGARWAVVACIGRFGLVRRVFGGVSVAVAVAIRTVRRVRVVVPILAARCAPGTSGT